MKKILQPASMVSRRKLLGTAARGTTLSAIAYALGLSGCSRAQQDSVSQPQDGIGQTSIIEGMGAVPSAGIVGSTSLTILYLAGPDVTFDYDWYRDNHLIHIMERYGSNAISRFELRRPIDPANSDYVAVVNIWIQDAEAFALAGAEHGADIAAEVPMFTNTSLIVQTDRIHAESGGDLTSSSLGQACMDIFYPYDATATFDGDYYRDHHMPLIMDLYQTSAISRFELRLPDTLSAGNDPLFYGTVHFYIADQSLFDAAGLQHGPTLVADVANFSSQQPVVVPTIIHGLA